MIVSFISHVAHNGNSRARKKNGAQHTTKADVIMANVLAAFRSRLASSVSLRFLTILVVLFELLTWVGGSKCCCCCFCGTGVDIWLVVGLLVWLLCDVVVADDVEFSFGSIAGWCCCWSIPSVVPLFIDIWIDWLLPNCRFWLFPSEMCAGLVIWLATWCETVDIGALLEAGPYLEDKII
jgi:hypothetical protein